MVRAGAKKLMYAASPRSFNPIKFLPSSAIITRPFASRRRCAPPRLAGASCEKQIHPFSIIEQRCGRSQTHRCCYQMQNFWPDQVGIVAINNYRYMHKEPEIKCWNCLFELRNSLLAAGIGNQHGGAKFSRGAEMYIYQSGSCNEFKSLQMFCISAGLGPQRMSLSLKGWRVKKFRVCFLLWQFTLDDHSPSFLSVAERRAIPEKPALTFPGCESTRQTHLSGGGPRWKNAQERARLYVLRAPIVRILRPTARRAEKYPVATPCRQLS